MRPAVKRAAQPCQMPVRFCDEKAPDRSCRRRSFIRETIDLLRREVATRRRGPSEDETMLKLTILVLATTAHGLTMGWQRPPRPLLPAQRTHMAAFAMSAEAVADQPIDPLTEAEVAPKTLRSRLAAALPPANEMKKLLPLGVMFFCILFSYTILRDTKDVLVVTAPGGSAEVIPFLKTWATPPCQ